MPVFATLSGRPEGRRQEGGPGDRRPPPSRSRGEGRLRCPNCPHPFWRDNVMRDIYFYLYTEAFERAEVEEQD